MVSICTRYNHVNQSSQYFGPYASAERATHGSSQYTHHWSPPLVLPANLGVAMQDNSRHTDSGGGLHAIGITCSMTV
eukprot:scaffold267568_cov61-Attheya_sp.AAC.2